MSVVRSVSSYEDWLQRHAPAPAGVLARLHEGMRRSPAEFLRLTFFRWAEEFPRLCERLMWSPKVFGVGDLQFSSYGTWRDERGRLIWGVHDFTEACHLPFASDVVRLATSAILTAEAAGSTLSRAQIAQAIMGGYEDGVIEEGKVLTIPGRRHPPGSLMAKEDRFWRSLWGAAPAPVDCVPASILRRMKRALPWRDAEFRIVEPESHGRRRLVLLCESALAAWEATELAPSLWTRIASGAQRVTPARTLGPAVRAHDPTFDATQGWITRRLAPDCAALDLRLPEGKPALTLLRSMGWEAANLHLGSNVRGPLLADLALRKATWLEEAAQRMADAAIEDWGQWTHQGPRPRRSAKAASR